MREKALSFDIDLKRVSTVEGPGSYATVLITLF